MTGQTIIRCNRTFRALNTRAKELTSDIPEAVLSVFRLIIGRTWLWQRQPENMVRRTAFPRADGAGKHIFYKIVEKIIFFDCIFVMLCYISL